MFRRKALAAEAPPVEVLGEVRSASGDLLLLDFGLLRLWSAERLPLLEDGVAEPEVVERANAAGDYARSTARASDQSVTEREGGAVPGRYRTSDEAAEVALRLWSCRSLQAV